MKNQANQIEFHLHNCLSPKHRYSNKIYLQIFLRRGVAIALQISEMKSFATIAHGVSLLTIVAKSSILDIFGGPGYLSVTLVQNVLTSFFTMYPFDPPEKNMKKRVKYLGDSLEVLITAPEELLNMVKVIKYIFRESRDVFIILTNIYDGTFCKNNL